MTPNDPTDEPTRRPAAAAVSESVRRAYDAQYSDASAAWRELGGKYKAARILALSRGRGFERVLDCGAGEGAILAHLDHSGAFHELHAVEISGSGIAQIRNRQLGRVASVQRFDGYSIPHPDGAFDMAYCSHVVEHVEHPRLLLRELARVSRFQVLEIPLDYSARVDTKAAHFLGYGHINVYTPALFRFLLRTEGFEILDDRLDRIPAEVQRFIWYVNQGMPESIWREAWLRAAPLRRALKRLLYGESRYREQCFDSYTCLTQRRGSLSIFGQAADGEG